MMNRLRLRRTILQLLETLHRRTLPVILHRWPLLEFVSCRKLCTELREFVALCEVGSLIEVKDSVKREVEEKGGIRCSTLTGHDTDRQVTGYFCLGYASFLTKPTMIRSLSAMSHYQTHTNLHLKQADLLS